MDNSALRRPTTLQTTVLHILCQDTWLPVLGRGLVCQALPVVSTSSLALPSVLAAAAPTSQSDPLQPAPAREAQRVIAKGQHGLLLLKGLPIRAGLCSGDGIAMVVGVTAGESVGRSWLISKSDVGTKNAQKRGEALRTKRKLHYRGNRIPQKIVCAPNRGRNKPAKPSNENPKKGGERERKNNKNTPSSVNNRPLFHHSSTTGSFPLKETACGESTPAGKKFIGFQWGECVLTEPMLPFADKCQSKWWMDWMTLVMRKMYKKECKMVHNR